MLAVENEGVGRTRTTRCVSTLAILGCGINVAITVLAAICRLGHLALDLLLGGRRRDGLAHRGGGSNLGRRLKLPFLGRNILMRGSLKATERLLGRVLGARDR